MSSTINSQKITRPLYPWEVNQAWSVFGDALRYDRVRIHEYAKWPDSIDNIGRQLKGINPRAPEGHNAITLGYHCYFPVGLPINQPESDDPNFICTGWLIHELTHCWQYQLKGILYIYYALQAQFKQGENAYDFGGAPNLVVKRQNGWKIFDFNMEQQGNIAREFFFAAKNLPEQTAMYDASRPYILDIKNTS